MIDRWMRVVLPWWRQWLVAAAVVQAVGEVGLRWAVGWDWDVSRADLAGYSPLAIPGLFAGLYGLNRVVAFHPGMQHSYARWLQTTPWTSRQPLPLGPVHLVRQDAVVVGALAALAAIGAGTAEAALIVVQVFLTCYLVALGGCVAMTGEWACAYATGFGVGLTIRLAHDAPLGLAAGAAMYGVAWLGLKRSLDRFPWDLSLEALIRQGGSRSATIPPEGLGWPFAWLGPRLPRGIPTRDAVLLGALAGWWVYCIDGAVRIPGERTTDLEVVLGLQLAVLPLVRLLLYCVPYRPPISLWGRICTGRWVLPGYDRTLVAPLLAVAGGVLLWGALRTAGLAVEVYAALIVAFVLATVLGMGPSMRVWRLTGRHRIVATPDARLVKLGGTGIS